MPISPPIPETRPRLLPLRVLSQLSTRRLASRARAAERFVPGNHTRYFGDAAQALGIMRDAIRSARSSVLLEMYWFESDAVGRDFHSALLEARQRGVKVVFIYDALGSRAARRSDFITLQAAGAEVLAYNPIRAMQLRLGLLRWTGRNHKKLLIVDGERAFIGGVNLAAAWLSREQGGQAWKDEVLEIRGPVLGYLTDSFARTYRDITGRPLERLPLQASADGPARIAVLTQLGYRGRRHALNAYLFHIENAQQEVLIANAYFVPTRRIRRALCRAAARGVDVRIMLPHVSDVPVVRLASRAVWERLLVSGVRLYEWLPSVLHSKSAVIDRTWITAGSFNLDYLSVRLNRELNVSVLEPELASTMAESFNHDLASCHQVELASFRARSRTSKLLERAFYALRIWL